MTDKPTMEIDDYGNKYWYLNDKYTERMVLLLKGYDGYKSGT